MLGEGLFILAVSLSGDYTDMKYISNFPNCKLAMQYYSENCNEYKAASCTLKEYTMLGADYTDEVFDFDINDHQSCGFIGLDMRTFIKEK
tara:strand:- start:93 stop:362 length:270 start_codon:yes stop_codon:yes gene_type:complete